MEWWNAWFLLAQVMGLVTICFEFVSYQIKDQRKYLLVTSVGNVFWALMFVFMGLAGIMGEVTIMIIAAGFGTLRGMIFWWIFAKNSKRRKIAGRAVLYFSLAVMMPFTIIAITRLSLPQQIIIQSLGLVTGLLFIVGQYLPSKHYLRVFVFMYATVVLIGSTPLNLTGAERWNPMGIVIESAKIMSVLVFYIRFLITRTSTEIGGLKFEQLQKETLPKAKTSVS